MAGALITEGRPLPIVFEINKPSARQIYGFVRWCQRLVESQREVLEVVVEDQYLGLNPQSMLSVARSAERVLTVAELLGLRTWQVMPATWQSPCMATVPKSKGSTKARVKIAAAREFPEVEMRDSADLSAEGEAVSTGDLKYDPCDALMMAKWRASKMPRKRRQK